MFFNDSTALPGKAGIYETVFAGYETGMRQSHQDAAISHRSRLPRYETYETYETGGTFSGKEITGQKYMGVSYVSYVSYTLSLNNYSKLEEIYETLFGLYETVLGLYETLLGSKTCSAARQAPLKPPRAGAKHYGLKLPREGASSRQDKQTIMAGAGSAF